MVGRIDIAALSVVVLAALAYQGVFVPHGLGLIDEGHLAQAALRLVRGESLYRDVYTVYPPGSFHVVAGLFAVFGPSLIVVRVFHAVLTVALAATAYGVGRLFLAPPWALLAGLLVGASGWEAIVERVHYAHLYGVFPMAALGLLVAAFERERPRTLLFAVGVLAGATLAFRLVPFVGLAAATLVVLAAFDRRPARVAGRLGPIVAGGLAVVGPIVLAHAWTGTLGDLVGAVLGTSVGQYASGGELNLPFPALRLLPEAWTWAGLSRLLIVFEFYAPIAIYATSLGLLLWQRARRRGDRRPLDRADRARLLLVVFGAVLFLRVTGRSDYYHLAPVLAPAYLLGADLAARGLSRIAGPARGAGPLGWTVALALFVASGLQHDAVGAIGRALEREGRVALAPGGPWVEATSPIPELVADVRRLTQPGEPILVLPWYPVVYFLADRPNPTRFDWLFPGYLASDAERERFVRSIDAAGVRLVVYSPAAIDGRADRRLAVFEPTLDRALRRRFRPVRRHGHFLVMRRRPAPGVAADPR